MTDLCVDDRFPIVSEDCEPFAAMMIGKMWARAQAVKGDPDMYILAMRNVWWTAEQLLRLSILASTATHFCIACNNHLQILAMIIKAEFGVDPNNESSWQWK